jgi:hypothetical protein
VVFKAKNSPGILGVSCVSAFHAALDNRGALNKQEGAASPAGFRRQSPRRDFDGENRPKKAPLPSSSALRPIPHWPPTFRLAFDDPALRGDWSPAPAN